MGRIKKEINRTTLTKLLEERIELFLLQLKSTSVDNPDALTDLSSKIRDASRQYYDLTGQHYHSPIPSYATEED